MNITKEITDAIILDSKILLKKDISEKYKLSVGTIRKIIDGRYIFDEYGTVNNNTTILRKIPILDVKHMVSNSFSYSEVIRKCGIDVRSSYVRLLRQICSNNNISVDHFNRSNTIQYIRSERRGKTDFDLFTNDSNISPKTVKDRIIKKSLIKYECKMCGIVDNYNNKPLRLQLDHINGNNKDHRLENLRFLCPNCHSQTETFTGRNLLKKVRYCIDCGKVINRKSVKCVECSHGTDNVIKFEITKDELEKLLKEKTKVEISKMFGVTDNVVRQRCVVLGINQ